MRSRDSIRQNKPSWFPANSKRLIDFINDNGVWNLYLDGKKQKRFAGGVFIDASLRPSEVDILGLRFTLTPRKPIEVRYGECYDRINARWHKVKARRIIVDFTDDRDMWIER